MGSNKMYNNNGGWCWSRMVLELWVFNIHGYNIGPGCVLSALGKRFYHNKFL